MSNFVIFCKKMAKCSFFCFCSLFCQKKLQNNIGPLKNFAHGFEIDLGMQEATNEKNTAGGPIFPTVARVSKFVELSVVLSVMFFQH